MGHHLNKSGEFQSDKYSWCPEGFLALKFSDPKARQALLIYANSTDDAELKADILEALGET